MSVHRITVVTVALNFKNLQSGEVTTSTISGRCSEYSLANSADEAIRSALGALAENIYEYYNEVYPIRANIIERGRENMARDIPILLSQG